MKIDPWWIIENYYNKLVDFVFKSNVTKNYLFRKSKHYDEITFKNANYENITQEFNPPDYSNDYESDEDHYSDSSESE